ncbi:MAG TPA: alpha-L-fucosidase [Candidatus Akkermansia intestinavium]|nr:alpha-L-fucosidase [Candidatus Akkermansia intestinavium]
MIRELMTLAACAAVLPLQPLHAAEPPKPCGAVPTKQQVDWLRMEWYAFVHFGLNTYTNREWGYGDESPKLFNPGNFDAGKIVATFKKAGMTGMIYTAKHHDGWCAWPTRSTEHNITKSPWKNGKGDVVREFAKACKKHGIKFGTYLSPWDRNCAEYGRPGYLDVYYAQIKELLTDYGPIFEIWFDGANGGDGYYGGKREKRNIGNADKYYNFKEVVRIIRSIQPDCIIWGAGGHGDVTWGGSEKGFVRLPNWNVQGMGTKNEKWISLEGDTPINHAGWFWHPGQASKVKSPEHLMGVYFDSVGRGANLILNVAANRDGQLDPADVASLLKFGENRRRLLANDYALGAKVKASEVRGKDKDFAGDKLTDGDIESYWCPNDGTTKGELEITLDKPVTFDVVRVREQIRLGQRVKDYRIEAFVDGDWKVIDPDADTLMKNQKGKPDKDKLKSAQKTIGNQALRRLDAPVTTDRVKLVILDARACPCISEFSLLRMPREIPAPVVTRKGNDVSISEREGFEIVYTTDGSEPTIRSPKFKGELEAPRTCTVSAAYLDSKTGEIGSTGAASFGEAKVSWKSKDGQKAIDDDPNTFWQGDKAGDSMTVDLGRTVSINAFSYLPRQDGKVEDMTDQYIFSVSQDGKKWRKVAEGEFSNLRANPIELKVDLDKTVKARFFRFTGKRAIEGKGVTAAEINVFSPETSKKASRRRNRK